MDTAQQPTCTTREQTHCDIGGVVTHTPGTPALDVAGLADLIGDDKQQLLRLLEFFNTNAPAALNEFRQVMDKGSCSAIGMIAHKLRSSALSVCASELADVCLSLETAARQESWGEIELMVPLMERELGRVVAYIEKFSHCEPAPPEALFAREFDAQFIGKLSVLLIDDDPQSLMLGEIQLAQLGTQKVIARDGADKALAYLREHACDINIVLCDLNMPGRDGLQFIRLLSETAFDGGLVLVSGEDEAVLNMAGKLARERGLQLLGTVSKPLTRRKIELLLQEFAPAAHARGSKAAALTPLDETDLERALLSGEIVAHFQPKIDLAEGTVEGVEALVRWNHPERGLIPPVAFLPIAERHDLMEQLTDCVFEQGMQCSSDLRGDGFDVGVAINLPASILTNLEWPDHAAELAGRHDVATPRVTFELTETGLVADSTAAIEILTRMRLKGFLLSVDDFGTGYSSMEQLLRAPFTELKIDRGFVRGAMTDPSAAAILESSVALAKRLGLRVVAEGVETREELAMVAGLGCDTVQGYFIGKPMPYPELRRWMEEWPERPWSLQTGQGEQV